MSLSDKIRNIKKVHEEFWTSTAESNTSMRGLADIWEGPTQDGGVNSDSNVVIAVETFKNNVYILHGGGANSWLKVVTPNGPVMYDLGSWLVFLTKEGYSPPYFSMAVLNEDEVIAGHMYLNLKHQFMIAFSEEYFKQYDFFLINIANVRISSSSWLTGIRVSGKWEFFLYSKANIEDCLPCSIKQGMAEDKEFTCEEEDFKMNRLEMPGYHVGGLSFTRGGNKYGTRVKKPIADASACMEAMNGYIRAFNQVNVNQNTVGNYGHQLSDSCSSGMYRNIVAVSEYKIESKALADKYIEEFISGNNDTGMLKSKSAEIVGFIASFLYEISTELGDNDFTHSLMRDTTWWAPIWFIGNPAKLDELDEDKNAYDLLHDVKLDEFIVTLLSAARKGADDKVIPDKLSWIMMGRKNQKVYKASKDNMTFIRLPDGQCLSVRKVFEIPLSTEYLIDGICGIEFRGETAVVWAWLYSVERYEQSTIKAFTISKDGIIKKAAELMAGDGFSPVSGSPMAASDAGDKWIIRDFFLSDINTIDYVESKVSSGLQDVKKGNLVVNYANVNEGRYYGDGALERESEWGPYDLDSNAVKASGWAGWRALHDIGDVLDIK